MTAHQLIGEVQLAPGQQVQADRIDQNPGTGTLYHQVVSLPHRVELEAVLKARAPASEHGDPERGCRFPRGVLWGVGPRAR